ncbi:hypothetical protein BH23PLA1_BH23PLA1_17320 [soil metagenome]
MIALSAVGGFDARCLEQECGEGFEDPSALASEVRQVAFQAYALLRGTTAPAGPEDELARLRERVERLRRRLGRLARGAHNAYPSPAGDLVRWAEALYRRIDDQLVG